MSRLRGVTGSYSIQQAGWGRNPERYLGDWHLPTPDESCTPPQSNGSIAYASPSGGTQTALTHGVKGARRLRFGY